MDQSHFLISVVDDNESIREALPDLLRTMGFDAEPFSAAETFLSSDAVDRSHCLILDVSMPGMSGPELQCELRRRKPDLPIIFITAQIDSALRADLLAAGAVACLFKPFGPRELQSVLDEVVGAIRAERSKSPT
jgi:FixJ family two-component response regulator